ncbi:MAG: hypothetical protein ACKOOC_11055, partial [Cyanobium sp.]
MSAGGVAARTGPCGEGMDAGSLVLVLNAGSSSIKAQMLDPKGQALWKGQTDWQPNIPAGESLSASGFPGESALPNPMEGVLRDWLLPAIAPWRDALLLVGHRVVHGGTNFTAPTRLTGQVRRELAALTPLAPLHNGPALAVIEAFSGWQPGVPQWACFDTAFHHT